MPRLDVPGRVPDRPTPGQIQRQLLRRLRDHPRARLAQRAVLAVRLDGRLGVVRAELVPVDDGLWIGVAEQVIDAMVPLSEMFGYSTKLRSMTQGRAVYSMEFAHYEEVPKSKAEEIINKVTAKAR